MFDLSFISPVIIGIIFIFLIWRLQLGIDSSKREEKKSSKNSEKGFKFPSSKDHIIFDFESFYQGKYSIILSRFIRLLFLPVLATALAGIIGLVVFLFSDQPTSNLSQYILRYASIPFLIFAVPMIIIGLGKATHFIIYPDLYKILKGVEYEKKARYMPIKNLSLAEYTELKNEARKKALELYSQALLIAPSVYANLKIAKLKNSSNDGRLSNDEQMNYYNQALEIKPDSENALVERAFLKIKMYDFQGAVEDALKVHEITKLKGTRFTQKFPVHYIVPFAYWHLGIAKESEGNIEEALQANIKGYSFDPNKGGFLFTIARLKHWQKKYEESLDFYIKGIEVHLDYVIEKRNERIASGQKVNLVNELIFPNAAITSLVKNLGKYPNEVITICNSLQKYNLNEWERHSLEVEIQEAERIGKRNKKYDNMFNIPNNPFEKDVSDQDYYIWLLNRFFDLADFENAERAFLIYLHNDNPDFREDHFHMIHPGDMRRWIEIKIGLFEYRKALEMVKIYNEKSNNFVSSPEFFKPEQINNLEAFLKERAEIKQKMIGNE